jgi:hypothetical protein
VVVELDPVGVNGGDADREFDVRTDLGELVQGVLVRLARELSEKHR